MTENRNHYVSVIVIHAGFLQVRRRVVCYIQTIVDPKVINLKTPAVMILNYHRVGRLYR